MTSEVPKTISKSPISSRTVIQTNRFKLVNEFIFSHKAKILFIFSFISFSKKKKREKEFSLVLLLLLKIWPKLVKN